MARRRRAERRTVLPDPKYNSELVARVINYVMRAGKKSTAERIIYGAMNTIQARSSEDPLGVLIRAIDNIKPRVEVKSRRVGGATYQVPVEVGTRRQLALALRWLVQYSSTRRGMPMEQAVALELLDAFKNEGACIKKREDTHRMAQANKAFAHYAW